MSKEAPISALGTDKLVEFIPVTGVNNPPALSYATKFSSGIDLRAYFNRRGERGSVTLYPGQTGVIGTGYKCKIHPNYEIQIRSRGGLAANSGIFVLNSPGTVDADYEGEIKVILHNVSPDPFIINHGDRIAQAVLCPIMREQAYMIAEPKERGEGGFGSTGVK